MFIGFGTKTGVFAVQELMTRRGKVWASVTLATLALPPLAWYVLQPRVPVAFLGKAPGKFVFKSEFEGKPLIDWKLPGGNKLVYPKKRKMSLASADANAICGYIELAKSPPFLGSGIWFRSEDQVSAGNVCYAEDPTAKPAAATPYSVTTTGRSSITFTTRSSGGTSTFYTTSLGFTGPGHSPLLAIPYATDEAYRSVELSIEQDKYKLRLPVSDAFGPAIRKSSTIRAGPYEIDVKPRPWRMTTSPFVVDLTVPMAADRRILIEAEWDNDPKSNVRFFRDVGSYLLGPGDTFTIDVDRMRPNPSLVGDVFELEPVPLKLIARRKSGTLLQLYLESGECVYGRGSAVGLGKAGFKVIECRDRLISTDPRLRMKPQIRPSFTAIRDGEIVDAVGYRTIRRWPYKRTLDAPPPLTAANGLITFSNGARMFISPPSVP